MADVEAAGQDEAVRAVLVTAEGDHFCSGFDIVGRNAEGSAKAPGRVDPAAAAVHRAHRLIPVVCTTQVPVVVAARGWVAGIGLHLAAAADFLVLADDARMWSRVHPAGLHPDSGGTWLLPRLVDWRGPGSC